MPLGKRRESDRDGYHERNEPENLRVYERAVEPHSTVLRNNQFRWGRIMGIELRNANGINGRDGDYEE